MVSFRSLPNLEGTSRDLVVSFSERHTHTHHLPLHLPAVGSTKPVPCPSFLGKTKGGKATKTTRIFHLKGPMRDTPPYRAIPFRDSIPEGGFRTRFPCFIGYRASMAEIPLLWGGIAPPLRMLSKGESLRKAGEGIAPNWPCCDTNNRIARNRGVSLR